MAVSEKKIRVGMVGAGMIFRETYQPLFEQFLERGGLYDRRFGVVEVELAAITSRTSRRESEFQMRPGRRLPPCSTHVGDGAVRDLLNQQVDAVCVAIPDHRHFEPAKLAINVGKHVLIEKPSVLTLQEQDELT